MENQFFTVWHNMNRECDFCVVDKQALADMIRFFNTYCGIPCQFKNEYDESVMLWQDYFYIVVG